MTAHRSQAARWLPALVSSVLVTVLAALPSIAFAQTARSLQFNGTSQYVTFGKAYALQAQSFTVECWFKRSGNGTVTSTGTGGWSNIVPLLTKGRGEAETPDSLNTNYFLGIRSDGILAADFEEPSGPNHPIGGVTVITNGVWNHAALTFNFSTGRYTLYLNGAIEKDTTLTGGISPANMSIQHAALGTAMTSTGGQAGFFQGLLDEPRIWSVARTQAEIQGAMNVEVLTATGLIGHWSLNEASGTTALCSTVNGPIGTLNGPPTSSTDVAVPLLTATGLRFGNAATSYVTFGANAALGLPQFTLETWFRRDGTGTANQTGAGGIAAAIPLISKGRNQAETPANLNMNYYMGINTAGNVLCADFEDAVDGTNHPINGTTAIPADGVWHHAAATYNGTTWRLYLDGNLEATASPGIAAEGTSIQHAGLGTAMTSDGTAAGFFNGLLDEARIWNFARSQAQIQSSMNTAIPGASPGLVARWGMNEDAGLTVANSAGGTITGTLTGSNWSWGTSSPFNAPLPPSPADPSGLSATPVSPTRIDLAWTDNATNEAAYEVERSTTGVGGPYTLLITLPEGSTSYSNTGLTASTEYCYRVRATNGGGASGYAGPTCATTLASPPPNPPTNLVATAPTYGQVHLTWTDNATDETSFELERSTSGSGGPFTLLATLGANTVAYDDLNLSGATEYCYRLRAVNGNGGSTYATVSCATTPAPTAGALDFNTTGTYASFGNPAALHLSEITVEMWIRRDGAGTGTDTGSLGIPNLIPLVAKGRAEAEDPLKDINYIVGLRASDFVLAADFEEGAPSDSVSKNHPIIGTTPIGTGAWHHVAATYDGTWRLYLDGQLNAQLPVNKPLASASNVAVSIATALNSTNATGGFFDGALDEVRVWSVARSLTEIRSTINSQLATPQTNLVARWSLDENTGTILNGTPTTVNGTITGANFSWVPGAPFDLVVAPPNAPSGLAATSQTYSHVHLTWNDNSSDETSFVIERSTTGIGGSYTVLATLAAGTTAYDDVGLSGSTEYCYRVHASNGIGSSSDDGPVCVTTPFPELTALDLSGNAYASFGNPSALKLSSFTIEMWMRRDGPGTGTNTGSGGIPDAIPLLTKGRAESESPTLDINYFFGIRNSDGVLCLDFEEGAGGANPSQNHPVFGTTTLPAGGSWHHVAATYDGATMKLYLDGAMESSSTIGQPLAAASTVAVALGSALNSGNTAAGFFDGAVDEVRVWNVARSPSDIQAVYNAPISVPASGLVARWAVDEGYGGTVGGSAGTALNGTLNGTYSWLQPGAPLGTLATLVAGATHVDASCFGGSDGSIDLTVTGGVPPYTYAWSNGASAQDLSGLTAGNYTVTVTDATGATANSGATIGQPAQLAANAVATPASVYGGNDGAVDLTVAGGTTPYTYAWSNSATSEDLTGLVAASYTVTVTDAHGCTANAGATVTEPTQLVASATHVDVSCFGASTGSIDLSVSGGVPPYTYAWSNGTTSEDLTAVQAGSYSVTVTDANGATANAGATIIEPTELVSSAVQGDPILCNGGTTTVTVSATGGTPPYGGTGTFTVGAGTYDYTVSDDHGCSAIASIAVTQPDPATPPQAPTDLIAVALDAYRVQLNWIDASTDEDAFEIERSETGDQGLFESVATLGADATAYLDLPLRGATQFCYRVRAVKCGARSDSSSACVTTGTEPCMALDVTPAGGPTGGHVRVVNDATLKLSEFTLELWMRRDGTGIGTSTGNGGIPDAVPLIAKGRSQDDDPAHNTNYVLAIRESDGVLCADFEEGPGGSSPGTSHPVFGSTPIGLGSWHHVAATYDGEAWSLYLDGNLEATLVVNEPACAASDVRVALASALNSGATAAGFFDGAIDEARIWRFARSQSEIQGSMNQTMAVSDPNLIGRWAFDESFGSTAFSTSGFPNHGVIEGVDGTNWDRVPCGGWVTAVDEPAITEVSFARVAPNPTRGATRFDFALPRSAHVQLDIHDVLGRRVATVASGDFSGGVHRLAWNGANDRGGPAPNGMYYARFRSGRTVTTKAFVILR